LSSPQEPARVSVRILEKEYFITCPYEERSALLDSAEFLNARMREVRDSGKVVGLDRIAVMVALNLTNELLQLKSNAKVENEAGTRVRNMRERVEARLAAGQSGHKSDSRSDSRSDKSRQSENGRQLEL
jgi:cell division protein ZapA